ncbi:orotidine 5'-phosphate decarboxylase [Corynebacterium urogenitale]|uniref:Orotidine-5'-phosphate decarboxylase n=1 Tax=Corynebacterium urogenitale TaxID=2487892 RepID=A0A5J6ZAP9_9CORY|nr:orotidine-5'-phosphate decarboxylase [Corynebacterium urogenitale]QFQ02409.1 orotidine 5'-phosphate decarboxylase [Corynebacterium urogenitale]
MTGLGFSAAEGTFGERFLARAEKFGQVCVGMDPHASILENWGLEGSVEGLKEFSRLCVEAFEDTACVVKPQVAFYEAFGSAGFAVLEDSIRALRAQGVLIVSDAKRGDIGSTMAGYAHAWLSDDSPLVSDAVTVSPWLGFGSLDPVFELAEATGRGAIVLAATSNPEAPEVQRSRPYRENNGVGEYTLAQYVVDNVAERNSRHEGAGNLGVVVGATVDSPPDLRNINGMILMPGVGAQGGTMEDVRRIAGSSVSLVSPNVSRGVLREGPKVSALRDAVRRTTGDMLK